MTIKQHGGIFGRNPTFNSVETESLTIAGDAVPDASTILVDGDIGSTVQGYDADTAKLDVAQTFTAAQTFNENIVMANTKGIDFSATAGTGTSELFDDYEEGTWTPIYVTQNSSAITITYDATTHGKYTKVGNAVFITGSLKTDSVSGGSGIIRVDGLPYAASSPNSNIYPIYIGSAGDFAGDHPISGNIVGSSFYPYYRSSVNGGIANLDVSDLGTGANNNSITFAAMYFIS